MPLVGLALIAAAAVTFGKIARLSRFTIVLNKNRIAKRLHCEAIDSAAREKPCMLGSKFMKNSYALLTLWTVLQIGVLQVSNLYAADGQWQPKDGAEGMPQFIVPPGDDPTAYSPSHWGLTDKSARPAPIPAIERPTTATPLPGPRPDYQHMTSFGDYEPKLYEPKLPKQPKQPKWNRPPSADPNSVLYAAEQEVTGGYFDEVAGQTHSAMDDAYMVDQSMPVEGIHGSGFSAPPALPQYSGAPSYGSAPKPRNSLLQMTAAQAAYQPSPYHVKPPEPTFGEIVKTGAAFLSFEALFLEPHFQGNSAITFDSPTNGSSSDYDYGFLDASKITLGFESQKGPGFKLTYWELSDGSKVQSGFSDGTQTATTAIFLSGPRRTTTLSASNAGERITAQHNMWIKNTSAIFFKEIKMPVSRLNGMLGFRYVNIHHTMHSEVFDAGNVRQGVLHGTHYFRGIGPTIGLEYFRPIGHTHIEFLGGATTTLVYGRRDQIAYNTAAADFTRFGTDELVSSFDAKLGAQWVREWGRRYRIFVRGSIVAQSWFGGGTASDPAGDFGLFGLGFAAGLNH